MVERGRGAVLTLRAIQRGGNATIVQPELEDGSKVKETSRPSLVKNLFFSSCWCRFSS